MTMVALALAIAWAAQPIEVVVADLASPPFPRLVGERLPPQCQLSLTPAPGRPGRAARLDYVYPGIKGVSYAAFGFDEPLPGKPLSLSFDLYGDASMQDLFVRIADAAGEVFQFSAGKISWRGWKTLRVRLDSASAAHWGGDRDGVIDLPCTLARIIVDSTVEPSSGTVYLGRVTLTTLAEAWQVLRAEISTGWFGNVVFSREPWTARILVRNRAVSQPVSVPIRLAARHWRGRATAARSVNLALRPGQTAEIELNPYRPIPGINTVRVLADGHQLASARVTWLPGAHPLRPAARPFFGVCTHFGQFRRPIREQLLLMRRAGIEWLRDELYWNVVERSKGSYTFPAQYDEYMTTAHRLGIEPVIVCTYVNDFYDNGQAPHTPEGRRGYANYVRALMRRYGRMCRWWEIYNEPNIGFWRGRKPNPAEYFPLLREAYSAIKDQDPAAGVIGICTAGTDFRFIKAVLDLGGANYMDALSVHPYRYPRAPEDPRRDFAAEMIRLHQLMSRYGMSEKKVWITEIGWPTHRGRSGVDEQTSANYLVRMFVIARSLPFMARVAWYDWQNDGPDPTYNEHNFGIIRWRTFEAKPSLVAMWVMTKHLSGAEFVAKLAPAGPSDHARAFLFRKAGRNVLVCWWAGPPGSRPGTITLLCRPGEYRVQWADAVSEQSSTRDGRITLTLSPMPAFVSLPAGPVRLER